MLIITYIDIYIQNTLDKMDEDGSLYYLLIQI